MPRGVIWDGGKAEANWRKHAVRFDEAETVFFDPLLLSIPDSFHSDVEERFVAAGISLTGRLLVIVSTIRDDDAWIISAREATRAERRRYMSTDRVRDAATDAEIETEYDFSGGIRGLHSIEPRGSITVTIDPVVAEYFRDEQTVNDALRKLIAEGRAPKRAE